MKYFDLNEYNRLNNTDFCIIVATIDGLYKVSNEIATAQKEFYLLFSDLNDTNNYQYIRFNSLDFSFHFDDRLNRVCVELL